MHSGSRQIDFRRCGFNTLALACSRSSSGLMDRRRRPTKIPNPSRLKMQALMFSTLGHAVARAGAVHSRSKPRRKRGRLDFEI